MILLLVAAWLARGDLLRIGVGHEDSPYGWDSKNSMLTWYQRFNFHKGAECEGLASTCRCFFDKDITREELRSPAVSAVLFYYSPVASGQRLSNDTDVDDLRLSIPGRRADYQHQTWMSFVLEPGDYQQMDLLKPLGLTDWEVSYRQKADVWFSYIPADLQSFLQPPLAIEEKNALRGGSLRLAPIAAFISNCWAVNKRGDYMIELMKYISVDSYGKCHNNRDERATIETLRTMYADRQRHPNAAILQQAVIGTLSGKSALVHHYKFLLSFENTNLDDYVTEKFWDPLQRGAVPVYMGASNIDQFVPGDKAIIKTSDFESPKALAEFLIRLDSDDKLYGEYLTWKKSAWKTRFVENWARGARDKMPCTTCGKLCAVREAKIDSRNDNKVKSDL